MAATSGVVSGLVEKVTFVGKLPTLVKATSDDESPTPGYLYQEINAMLHESSSQCQQVLDYLVDRLNKDSFHVKIKVLRVMKHLIENGPSEFQQGLRRRAEGIKAATSYSGPPDPLHGHAPYVVVRKTATEVSSILFNTENCERSPNRPLSANNRLSVQTGIGNLQTSPGRMQGFGNTAAQNTNKSLGTTILSNLKGWTEGVSNNNQYQPIGGQPLQPHSSGAVVGGYKPAMIDTSGGQPGMQYSPQVSPQRKTHHTAGKAGGGWEDSTLKRYHGNNTHSKSDNSGDSTELSERLETVSVEDRTHETQLIADYTSCLGQAPSTRPPSRDELQQFVKRCSALNCDVILQLLNDKLSHSDAQVQLRILFVLEHLMKTDLVTTEQLLELFRPTLETLSTGRQGAQQAKATKILRQLTFLPPPQPPQKTEEVLYMPPTSLEVEAPNSSKFQTSLFSGMKLQTGVDRTLPGEKRNNLNQNGTVENRDRAGKEKTEKASGREQGRSTPLSKKKIAAGRSADPFNFVQDAMQACQK
ncbi:PREDICTED: AP-4 complex accessory subunit tepsin-like [Branchiostoma belcheri]|uniref:AP-4 complex accessory subunit tepsin-like n=1 Tax=Branchiostoma belcheri TaxID=7741 RepID=A0A6P5AEU7_BRABE|nr:PREDICTED: AP-4 complex accessory subunit tepsin-like [Branchiostoma belcheri]